MDSLFHFPFLQILITYLSCFHFFRPFSCDIATDHFPLQLSECSFPSFHTIFHYFKPIFPHYISFHLLQTLFPPFTLPFYRLSLVWGTFLFQYLFPCITLFLWFIPFSLVACPFPLALVFFSCLTIIPCFCQFPLLQTLSHIFPLV